MKSIYDFNDIMEMARPEGQTSNRETGALGKTLCKPPGVNDFEGIMEMAHIDGTTLNQIFDELARWEAILGETEIGSDETDPPAPN